MFCLVFIDLDCIYHTQLSGAVDGPKGKTATDSISLPFCEYVYYKSVMLSFTT